MNVFITGVSSGIGHGLAKRYSEIGWTVYGTSRREPEALIDSIKFLPCDLMDFSNISSTLMELLGDVNSLDLVILNAGVIGELNDMADVELDKLKRIMDINVWSNKVVLDCLFKLNAPVKQVVAISSGAAVNGNRGWNGYSISKAALNMMVKLYAREQEDTHFTALAPGLVDTSMQDYLCGREPDERFPSLEKLKDARGTERMPTPYEFAKVAVPVIETLPNYESGSFLDIRKMK